MTDTLTYFAVHAEQLELDVDRSYRRGRCEEGRASAEVKQCNILSSQSTRISIPINAF